MSKIKISSEQVEELRHLIFNQTSDLEAVSLLLMPLVEWLEKQDFDFIKQK